MLYLFPELSTVPSAARPLKPTPARRFRALNVRVGRVTSDTLLPLVSDVVPLEPDESLIRHTETRAGGRDSIVSRGATMCSEVHLRSQSDLVCRESPLSHPTLTSFKSMGRLSVVYDEGCAIP